MLKPGAVVLALGLGDADRDHLRGIVPLVDRGGDVEPFIALQPDQAPAQSRRQNLGDLGLADAGLAFEEDRPAHFQRQIEHGAERAVGEIIRLGEEIDGGVDGGRERANLCRLHRFPSQSARLRPYQTRKQNLSRRGEVGPAEAVDRGNGDQCSIM